MAKFYILQADLEMIAGVVAENATEAFRGFILGGGKMRKAGVVVVSADTVNAGSPSHGVPGKIIGPAKYRQIMAA